MLYYIKCKIKNYLKVVMDNYNSNNGRVMAFYIICLASYVLGGLCLTQFKINDAKCPANSISDYNCRVVLFIWNNFPVYVISVSL